MVVIVKWPSVALVNKGKKCSLNQWLIPKQYLIKLKQWFVPLPELLFIYLFMEYGGFGRFVMGTLFAICNIALTT